MYKTMKLKNGRGEEIDVSFISNAATAIRLKQIFNEDFWTVFSSGEITAELIASNLDVIYHMAYVMNQQAEEADMRRLNEDTFIDWLENFDQLALIQASPDIISIYLSTDRTASKAKNLAAPRSEG